MTPKELKTLRNKKKRQETKERKIQAKEHENYIKQWKKDFRKNFNRWFEENVAINLRNAALDEKNSWSFCLSENDLQDIDFVFSLLIKELKGFKVTKTKEYVGEYYDHDCYSWGGGYSYLNVTIKW